MQRTLFSLLLALSAFLFLPAHHAQAAGGEETAVAEVGTAFFKKYFASKDQWAYLLKSPLVTPAAKSAFLAIKKKADKDGGLDWDPTVKGQDHADAYKIAKIRMEGATATAVATAEGWPSLPMRFVRGKDGWQIDGVGEINIGAKH